MSLVRYSTSTRSMIVLSGLLLNDVTDESRVNLYNQWLWLTPNDILALQYCPKPSKQKLVPLSRGYHTHVTRFKAMYSELQCTPGWTDLDIFKIT
jgi:hypothetical protein